METEFEDILPISELTKLRDVYVEEQNRLYTERNKQTRKEFIKFLNQRLIKESLPEVFFKYDCTRSNILHDTPSKSFDSGFFHDFKQELVEKGYAVSESSDFKTFKIYIPNYEC